MNLLKQGTWNRQSWIIGVCESRTKMGTSNEEREERIREGQLKLRAI